MTNNLCFNSIYFQPFYTRLAHLGGHQSPFCVLSIGLVLKRGHFYLEEICLE